MKWFLVIWVATGGGFWTGEMFSSGSVKTQLEMPSQEICEQVRALNHEGAECWAKRLPDAPDKQPFHLEIK